MRRDARPAPGSKPRATPASTAAPAGGEAGGVKRGDDARRSTPGAKPPRERTRPPAAVKEPGDAGAPPASWRPVALAAVLGAALLFRTWNLGHGLPEFLDEALPFRWALAMWGEPGAGIDWNPHRFHHPSLATYLHLFVQLGAYLIGRVTGAYANPADYHLGFLVDPTPMALAARSVGVVADLATVLLVARAADGMRSGAGWIAALLVACSPSFIVGARSILSDTIMASLAIAAVERMLAYRARGGNGRLFAAAALIGLAAGAKYPAATLLGPLAVALFLRGGGRALATWPLAAAVAGACFLVTTPFAVLDSATFRRDLGFLQGLAQKGHLGNLVELGFLFHVRNLATNISWAGVALLAISIGWTVRHLRARPDALLLALALFGFGVPIAFARIEAERYLLPVLVVAIPLVAEAALAVAGRLPQHLRAPGLAALALLVAGPPALAGVQAVRSGGEESRIAARRWCEANVTSRDIVVQEHYAAPLLGRMEWLNVRSNPKYLAASPGMQRRYDARRWFASTTFPLAVVGSSANPVRPPSGPPVAVEVFPHAADFNRLIYEPRLLRGVDYFATTRSVRERFADSTRFAAQARFYALLDSTAEVAARFGPGPAGGGPEIVYYRLGARARQAIAALGPLDPLWWAEAIPPAYRERAESVLKPAAPSGGAVRLADGTPAAWVSSLLPVYEYLLEDFTIIMGMELAERGVYAEARRLATATLAMSPDDVQACVLYVICASRLGEWGSARAVLERSLRVLEARGETSPTLLLHRGEVLLNLGDRDGARRDYETVAALGGEIGAEARRRLAGMR